MEFKPTHIVYCEGFTKPLELVKTPSGNFRTKKNALFGLCSKCICKEIEKVQDPETEIKWV